MAWGYNIHLVPTSAEDWAIVEEVTGRDLGHYETFSEAESVARKTARRRRVQLVVHRLGQVDTVDFRPWYLRWFG